MVPNDERVQSPGVYRVVAIADMNFVADFFKLPLVGYDVVLGTHRLASLGPILWDFGTLQCPSGAEIIVCRGRGIAFTTGLSLRAFSSNDLMAALL